MWKSLTSIIDTYKTAFSKGGTKVTHEFQRNQFCATDKKPKRAV